MERPPQPAQNPTEGSQGHLSHETIKESAEEVISILEAIPNFDEHADISKMYKHLPNENLIVRREDPSALLHALQSNEPISIQFVGNNPYANSVEWNPRADGPRGLDNAYLEGYGQMNGVVLVYGFEKPDGFYFEQHPESQQVFAGIDRLRVRSAAGFVPPENIRFITVRIPLKAFPENRMTEEEKDLLWEYEQKEAAKRPAAFVYRGFLAKEKAADLPMAA